MKHRILFVDDDADMGAMVTARLVHWGIEVIPCAGAEEALEHLRHDEIDAMVTDVCMPGTGGIALCARSAETRPDVPVLVVTAFGSTDTVVAAIRAGAHDFLHKPFEIEELALRLEAAIRHRELRSELRRLRDAAGDGSKLPGLLGQSPEMVRLRELLSRVAAAEGSVVITGETGSGKELVARALHAASARSERPFVVLDCGAIPGTLLESELFGHARGAFTDARTERRGLLVQADGGTLFLDEIGELPLELQPKLLRALQERCVRPVGGDAEVSFDVRVVAATNRDLEAAVENGRFRRDLFFRLEVFHVAVPPLRSRGNDILLLAQRFLERVAARSGKHVVGISPFAAERLLSYPWPGNVRELQNCIERAVALTRFDQLVAEDLPERIRGHRAEHVLVASDDPLELIPLEEVERRYVLRVLEAAGGNKTLAARILGLDRKTLHRKLERFHAGPGGRVTPRGGES